MGGGRQCLVANVTGTPADPLDTWSCISKQEGRDLISDWKTDKDLRQVKYQVLENNEDLENMDESKEFTLGTQLLVPSFVHKLYLKLTLT